MERLVNGAFATSGLYTHSRIGLHSIPATSLLSPATPIAAGIHAIAMQFQR